MALLEAVAGKTLPVMLPGRWPGSPGWRGARCSPPARQHGRAAPGARLKLASPSASVLAGGSCSSGATKITFWAWVPGIARAVTAFNKSHPSICVTPENPGAGLPSTRRSTMP